MTAEDRIEHARLLYERAIFTGDRATIRALSTERALSLLLDGLRRLG